MYTVKKKVVLKQYNWHFLVLLIFCLEVSVDFKRISIFNAAEGEAVAVKNPRIRRRCRGGCCVRFN